MPWTDAMLKRFSNLNPKHLSDETLTRVCVAIVWLVARSRARG